MRSENMKELKEGFYYLTSPNKPKPTLVIGHKRPDMGGAFVFGLKTPYGGGIIPLSSLTAETKIVPVEITPAEPKA